MEKKELASILSEILLQIGFKKKGYYWVVNSAEIVKIINLQKSQFSNNFYINYGYILKSIPLEDKMHIYKRVASTDVNVNVKIKELLYIENNIFKEDRARDLKRVLVENLIENINSVNTEADILEELKKKPHLNDIPLIVKRHFHLPE
ncbi:MAG: DUF4304 domain-containing protein [Sphingobacteriales bacterium]|nr:MAG: DUF4304 domain-containing protein [Sphingobacteriales bacterium]